MLVPQDTETHGGRVRAASGHANVRVIGLAAVRTNHCLRSLSASVLAISARSVEASAVAAAPGDRKGRGPLYGRSSRDTASERPTKQRPYD